MVAVLLPILDLQCRIDVEVFFYSKGAAGDVGRLLIVVLMQPSQEPERKNRFFSDH
jgi:hypothetical protein